MWNRDRETRRKTKSNSAEDSPDLHPHDLDVRRLTGHLHECRDSLRDIRALTSEMDPSMRLRQLTFALALSLCSFSSLFAQPSASGVKPAREIPPPGIALPADQKAQLNKKRLELSRKISALSQKNQSEITALIPDVEIFARAVQLAIEGNTFYTEQDIANAHKLLETGLARAQELAQGKHSWTTQTGPVARGYRSILDGTVQPYGVVIGPDVKFDGAPVRCDIWFRGRSEKGLELQFINDRMTKEGEYKLTDGIMLHPMGRYCNANRFAGEVDVFEALEHARSQYAIDENRIAVGGFSMGGAACWGFTVHYPGKWFASYPGAGFSETFRFLGMDKNPDRIPADYQQKLWNLYDAHVLADNLYDIPTIAYSGEKDGQKMAADIMVESAAKYGLTLPHVIGPDTAHKLHPDSKKIISERLAQLAEKGRNRMPASLRFTTYTLKYNNCAWVTIDALKEHWAESWVHADLQPEESPTGFTIKTKNVTGLTVEFPADISPFPAVKELSVQIDGQTVTGLRTGAQKELTAHFQLQGDKWKVISEKEVHSGLVKRHDLQGPIDDALMGPFLFVKPTGSYVSPQVGEWVKSEMDRASKNWQRQMRGLARVRRDVDVNNADIRENNLILWGCPKSNALIKKVLPDLPIQWSGSELVVGDKRFQPEKEVLVMVYPNPLNPERYIVINSGLTYREFDYENNARQTPKLPDWAVIDTSTPPNDVAPGKIVEADFFDEQWKVKTAR